MEVMIISQTEVRELLPIRECMAVMRKAFEALAQDEAILPLRPTMWLPDEVGALVMMPAYLDNVEAAGLKVITYFAGNRGSQLDTHQGAVMLFDSKNGRLLAIVDATEITSIRTAAVSAVVTELLARPDAHDLALLGSGTQARIHLESMLLARSIRRVRVWSRTRENALDFADRESRRHGITVEPVRSAAAAVRNADLICTTTSSHEPVLKGEWLAPGTHINAVGSSIPFARELDTAAVVRSRLFVDKRESALNEAGDFLFPKKEGAIGDDHILGEIGDILVGKIEGRRTLDEITLFKSLGLAIEDLASAHYVYQKAVALDAGTMVELGGYRHETT